MPGTLLLVEDDPLLRRAISRRLRTRGHSVREADSLAAARALLPTEPFEAVLLDYRLPDGTGFDLMPEVERRLPGVPMVVLTAHATVDHAVEAMRRGAYAYFQKPLEPDELGARITKILESEEARREALRAEPAAGSGPGAEAFLGTSPAAADLRARIRQIARSPARAVLLEGESGTGKGLVARAIHEESPRAAAGFVSITCSAMPESLLESELFGHEPGAFTDARRRKTGLVEAAEGGTLFLDEIGDMTPPLQAKLLGVLEERRFRRVGGLEELHANVRGISATHRDLRALVRDGRFRADLLYRLRVVPLRIPPLRERREDVPLLAEHFTRCLAATWDRPAPRISDEALEALAARPWPGNVRELRNAVERAVILSAGGVLGVDDFHDEPAIEEERHEGERGPTLPPGGLKIEEWTDDLVRQALRRAANNQSAAARLLGMSRDQIRYRMQRLGLLKGAPPE